MLVLASTSPRRADLLQRWGYEFTVVKAMVSEELPQGLPPKESVKLLAERKAEAGLKQWFKMGGSERDVVLGADTMVVLHDTVLGKPVNPEEAREMLSMLSGKSHQVLTGVSLFSGSGESETGVVQTTVTFRKITEQEIEDYVASGEPMDKAGSYGIQGKARAFVESVDGSLTNVIGLPMEYVSERLKAWRILAKESSLHAR